MSEQTVAFRYAKSLIGLAQEKGLLDRVNEDMKLFTQVCEDSREFTLALKSPIVKHWKKYEGVSAQIIEVYGEDSESSWKRKKFYHHKGFCSAAIISHLQDDTMQQTSEWKRSAESDSHQTKQQRMIESTHTNENSF